MKNYINASAAVAAFIQSNLTPTAKLSGNGESKSEVALRLPNGDRAFITVYHAGVAAPAAPVAPVAATPPTYRTRGAGKTAPAATPAAPSAAPTFDRDALLMAMAKKMGLL